MIKLRSNKREREIQEMGIKNGWEVLTKGYPDFLFYKEKTNEAIFVEVKRTCKTPKATGLMKSQKRMIHILRKLGLNAIVLFVN